MTDLSPALDAVTTAVVWLDRHNGRSDQELTLRVLKLGEEVGEAIAAWIGVVGQNPRKGVTHTREDVAGELCDVVQTALVAAESIMPGTTAEAAALIIEAAEARKAVGGSEITRRLLFLASQAGIAAEVRGQGRGAEAQVQWLRITAAVALAIVAELGFDPAETYLAKARKITARIAEMEAAR